MMRIQGTSFEYFGTLLKVIEVSQGLQRSMNVPWKQWPKRFTMSKTKQTLASMCLILRTKIYYLRSTWSSQPICRDAFHIGRKLSTVLEISVRIENFERSTDLATTLKTPYGVPLSLHLKGYFQHNMKTISILPEVYFFTFCVLFVNHDYMFKFFL